MTITDPETLLRDLREFIATAQRAEAALAKGDLNAAAMGIALIAGQSLGLAMRVGLKFEDTVALAVKDVTELQAKMACLKQELASVRQTLEAVRTRGQGPYG